MAHSQRMALSAVLALLVTLSADAQVPANPSNPFLFAMGQNVYQTKNYIIGSYHYVQCYSSDFLLPSSTAEVAQALAHYYKMSQAGTPVTLRTSRPMFHSSATFPCPVPAAAAVSSRVVTEKGQQAAQAPVTVGLLQHKLNKVLAADKTKNTMRVGAGMRYTEFLKEAQAAGMSVQVGTPTVYAGLSLAGVLATSAHGSGFLDKSGIWDTLLEITWVDGTGKVHVSKPQDPEFRGMVGGLGVYGVITELLMQMTPLSYTTLTTIQTKDTNMFRDVNNMLKTISPHILVFWRPEVNQFRAFMVKEAAPGAKIEPKAVATLLPNIKDREAGAEVFRVMSKTLHDDRGAFEFLCPQQVNASVGSWWASVDGKGVFNVTGHTNNLQASECDEHCNWNDQKVFNGTTQDVEFTIEFDQLESWIKDVQKIFQMDLWENGKARYRCLGPGYLWIRYGQPYDGFTATNAGMKAPVYVQSTWLRSRMEPNYPMRYQFVMDVIEELTLCKYKGRPHWGKNFDRTFTHPKCGVRAMYPKFGELLKLQAKYDPGKMLEPRLFRKVADRESFTYTPGCSTWMKCYCTQDSHCPLEHKCVPSAAFPEYKVCKTDMSDKPDTIMPVIFATMAANNAGRRLLQVFREAIKVFRA